MTVKINKPALNLREELASLRNQGGLPKEDKLYVGDFIQNGDFSNGLSGWTSQVAGFTVTGGEAVGTSANGLYPQIEQTFKADIGKTYKVVVGKAQLNSGFWLRVRASHGGTTDTLMQNNNSGSDVNMTGDAGLAYFTARSSEVTISLEVRDGAVGTFDNISVQEVGENLVTNGTFDTDSGYIYSGSGWAISGGVATHSGGSGAYIEQHNILKVGKTYTVTFDVTAVSGGGYVQLYGVHFYSGGHFNSVGTHSLTFTSSANYFRFRSVSGSISIDNVILTEGNHQVIQSIPYGYDVKDVYIDGELAREGEGYDYEVKTDGINQWLKPTIEPTATTETAVIGVRK